MRTHLAAYREEICRLHHANDTLAESNRILLDAVTTMKMEHAAGMQRLRGEMAPGFSWPDPDQSALVERYKTRVGELEAEVRALKRRYEHQNLSGKTEYTRKRSRVSEDMTQEAEDAAGSSKKTGPPAGHKGCSHSNKPVRKVWHVFARCANCGGRHIKRGRCRCRLVNDFDGSHINIQTVAHMGWEYACADCGHVTGPDFPAIPGTSFGKKALGYIVYFGGKKNTDADIANYFGDLFHFETAETTIWNARRAAAGMLEQTMRYIMEELKRATFLGIDETRYTVNGKIGYVWVVRTDRAAFVLPMGSRSGLVLSTYFSGLADKPVVVDGYAVYPGFFKTIQRCWAHILRDAEAAYVSVGRNGPKREYYHTLYRRLLKVFHDAKRIADDAAGSGGADVGTCLDLERRVLEIATAYADHGFRTTLTNAAPNLFTFLRYPGMPPSSGHNDPITWPEKLQVSVMLQSRYPHWPSQARSADPNSKDTDPGRLTPFCEARKRLWEHPGRRMRAAGVRRRVHAGRQREEAGKSGTKGEGQVRKVQALGVPGQEEGPQHTQDIQGSKNRLLDYPRLAAADARPRTEGQVQREAQGAKSRAPPPDHPYRAAPAQEEPEKVWL